MVGFKDDPRDPGYSRAIRTELGERLRKGTAVTEPMPEKLVQLLKELEVREDRGTKLRLGVRKRP
jgi:hypothetical protein